MLNLFIVKVFIYCISFYEMSWKFHVYKEEARVGAESAIDASDYFVDEVIEPFKILGKMFAIELHNGNKSFTSM